MGLSIITQGYAGGELQEYADTIPPGTECYFYVEGLDVWQEPLWDVAGIEHLFQAEFDDIDIIDVSAKNGVGIIKFKTKEGSVDGIGAFPVVPIILAMGLITAITVLIMAITGQFTQMVGDMATSAPDTTANMANIVMWGAIGIGVIALVITLPKLLNFKKKTEYTYQ